MVVVVVVAKGVDVRGNACSTREMEREQLGTELQRYREICDVATSCERDTECEEAGRRQIKSAHFIVRSEQ